MGTGQFTIALTDFVAISGDSITVGFLDPSDGWPGNGGFRTAVQGRFGNPPSPRPYPFGNSPSGTPTAYPVTVPSGNPQARPSSGQSVPYLTYTGVVGQKMAGYASSVSSLIPAGATKVILVYGINDAVAAPTATTQAQYTTDMRAARDNTFSVRSTVQQILFVGPLSHGEKWPSGQNTDDTTTDGIDAKDSLMATIAAEDSRTFFVSWRDVYRTNEPIYNVGNAASGVLTSDGTHLARSLPTGEQLAVNAVLAAIAFSG